MVIMLPQNKQQNILMSQTKPYDPGTTKIESNISQPKEVIEDISLMNNKLQRNQSKLSMLEFRLVNKKVTLIDKSNISDQNILNIQSSVTLEVDSTLKEKRLKKFWTESSTEVSKNAWFPIKTGLHDLDTTSLNGFSRSKMHDSFVIQPKPTMVQTQNLRTISCPSSHFSVLDTMVKENTIQSEMYTRKIRFYPTNEQKHTLTKFFGAVRFTINSCLDFIHSKKKNNDTADIKYTNPVYFRKIKHVFFTNERLINDPALDDKKWLLDIPYDVREYAVRQMTSNYKTVFTQIKNKQIKSFKMKFKSRKAPNQTCLMNKKFFNVSTLRLCPKYMKKSLGLRRSRNIKRFKREIEYVDCNFTITKDYNGRYYLNIPLYHNREKIITKKNTISERTKEVKNANTPDEKDAIRSRFKTQLEKLEKITDDDQTFKYDTVALDPGVVTFQTFYSDQGIAGKLGDKLSFRLLCMYGKKEDYLKGLISTRTNEKGHRLTKKTIYNMKRRCSLLRTKIRNITNDLHWKSINFLTSNFKNILLPSFEVKQMTSIPRSIRKMGRSTVRRMLCLSHYKFKERMKYMCAVKGNNLYIVNEAYTSKTCGGCGYCKKDCTGRWYKCIKCGFELDRDYNGARNIFIKHVRHAGFDRTYAEVPHVESLEIKEKQFI